MLPVYQHFSPLFFKYDQSDSQASRLVYFVQHFHMNFLCTKFHHHFSQLNKLIIKKAVELAQFQHVKCQLTNWRLTTLNLKSFWLRQRQCMSCNLMMCPNLEHIGKSQSTAQQLSKYQSYPTIYHPKAVAHVLAELNDPIKEQRGQEKKPQEKKASRATQNARGKLTWQNWQKWWITIYQFTLFVFISQIRTNCVVLW